MNIRSMVTAVAAIAMVGCANHASLSPAPGAGLVQDRSSNAPHPLSLSTIYVQTGDSTNTHYETFPSNATGNVAPANRFALDPTLGHVGLGMAVDYTGILYAGGQFFSGGTGYPVIAAFQTNVSGTVQPLGTIQGADTGFGPQIGDVDVEAIDAFGDLFATSIRSLTDAAMLEYKIGAFGDVAPSRIIEGSATGLDYNIGPSTVTKGQGGLFFIATGGMTHPLIEVFTQDQSGNASPQTIGGPLSGISFPYGIATDKLGYLYVHQQNSTTHQYEIRVFSPNKYGDFDPSRIIAGPRTRLSQGGGIATDSDGRLYVANTFRGEIDVFEVGASGNVAPIQVIRGRLARLNRPSNIDVK